MISRVVCVFFLSVDKQNSKPKKKKKVKNSRLSPEPSESFRTSSGRMDRNYLYIPWRQPLFHESLSITNPVALAAHSAVRDARVFSITRAHRRTRRYRLWWSNGEREETERRAASGPLWDSQRPELSSIYTEACNNLGLYENFGLA